MVIKQLTLWWLVLLLCGDLLPQVIVAADSPLRARRILYNIDGASCMFTRAESKGPVAITVEDLQRGIQEITFDGSQVDTVLICVNCQATYFPTKVGTMVGALASDGERAKWALSDKQWIENLTAMFAAGVDPCAVMFAETKRRHREALLSFRMNDDHGTDLLRTQFWLDHPESRLGTGALDFGNDIVRDYTFRLIEEAVRRYDDCDGLELDFNRFPTFFKDGTTEERIDKINGLVERVRIMLDNVGRERGRRLTLSARIPSNYNRTPISYAHARATGCDPGMWAKAGLVDFITVSEFLYEDFNLRVSPWKQAVPDVPIYGGIECMTGPGKDKYLTPDQYRQAAQHLCTDGADGVYLFNFFTTREYGADASEPPFEVLRGLADPWISNEKAR